MGRPWQTWAAFGVCMAIVLGAMGWISAAALRLDRSEAKARRRAAVEENVRLALWRMDSAVAPLVARENGRPYFAYSSFYPAERAYTRMFAEIQRGEVLMPSPLLGETPKYVLIHFQLDPSGKLTSPQVPTGNMRDLAESRFVTSERVTRAALRLAELGSTLPGRSLASMLPPVEQAPASAPVWMPSLAGKGKTPQGKSVKQSRSAMDMQRRAYNVAQQIAMPQGQQARIPRPVAGPTEGLLKPVWLGSALVLARRVSVNDTEYIQGCWLDWPAIHDWLIESIDDLLPSAALSPVTAEEPGGGPRMLAALPVKLVPGPVPVDASRGLSPIEISLLVLWGCALLAGVAVAALLRGAIALSERRAAFVSAVTHELRTPLTTFRMYTEMLAEGMVPDAAKRQDYLDTLQSESNRLGHLVENVLAYARLERGRPGGRTETVSVGDLFDRMTDRLARHATQAGMTLAVQADPDALRQRVRVDGGAVEQILFNLVDNACKYAASASDRRVHVVAEPSGRGAIVRVYDHGPGIDRREARRLFRPFSKSAQQAATSAPGVGLGLALSRRLARAMGGDLHIDADASDGASFVLTLPAPPDAE